MEAVSDVTLDTAIMRQTLSKLGFCAADVENILEPYASMPSSPHPSSRSNNIPTISAMIESRATTAGSFEATASLDEHASESNAVTRNSPPCDDIHISPPRLGSPAVQTYDECYSVDDEGPHDENNSGNATGDATVECRAAKSATNSRLCQSDDSELRPETTKPQLATSAAAASSNVADRQPLLYLDSAANDSIGSEDFERMQQLIQNLHCSVEVRERIRRRTQQRGENSGGATPTVAPTAATATTTTTSRFGSLPRVEPFARQVEATHKHTARAHSANPHLRRATDPASSRDIHSKKIAAPLLVRDENNAKYIDRANVLKWLSKHSVLTNSEAYSPNIFQGLRIDRADIVSFSKRHGTIIAREVKRHNGNFDSCRMVASSSSPHKNSHSATRIRYYDTNGFVAGPKMVCPPTNPSSLHRPVSLPSTLQLREKVDVVARANKYISEWKGSRVLANLVKRDVDNWAARYAILDAR